MHGRSQTAAAAAESFKAWRLGLEMVPLEATSSGFFFFFWDRESLLGCYSMAE